VFHADATGATGNYIVWAEDGQADSVWADGEMKEQTLTGTIDYFTKTEYDPLFITIQTALNTLGISYGLTSIQLEEDTKYWHYEWVFDGVQGGV
jgi:viroplasmin and RNaseH domain-containing protein